MRSLVLLICPALHAPREPAGGPLGALLLVATS